MKIGGWTRIWIVLSVLLGLFIALVAHGNQPTLASIHRQWFSEAAVEISSAITKAEGQHVEPYRVRDKFFSGDSADSIAWLERIERSPKPVQRVFSTQVAHLNAKYRQRALNLPADRLLYWLQVFGWWLFGAILLYAVGWTVGWVVRGFRRAAT